MEEPLDYMEEEAPPEKEVKATKLLDELFRKTKATPCIYWLPLTDAQVRWCLDINLSLSLSLSLSDTYTLFLPRLDEGKRFALF